MVERAQRGTRGTVTAVVLALSALALLGNAIVLLLPRSGDAVEQKILTRTDLIVAYSRIRPGSTRASQLSHDGFDTTSAGAQVLSYLGMMERFMPHDSARFDQLDPAIKSCVAVRGHCTALIFRSASPTKTAATQGLFAALALGEAQPPTQVTLLIRDGRVTFKTISGVERASEVAAKGRRARAIPVPFRMAY